MAFINGRLDVDIVSSPALFAAEASFSLARALPPALRGTPRCPSVAGHGVCGSFLANGGYVCASDADMLRNGHCVFVAHSLAHAADATVHLVGTWRKIAS